MNTPEDIKALKKLSDMEEHVINGDVWTKFCDAKQFKVSPKGAEGDYDTDSYWVDYEDAYEVA